MTLPKDSAARKSVPIFSGPLSYFRRAVVALAQLCAHGNDKHNPGERLHWAREKSNDHTDCIQRHLFDAHEKTAVSPCGAVIGIGIDEETGLPHAVLAAWRALAHAELVLEHLAKTRE